MIPGLGVNIFANPELLSMSIDTNSLYALLEATLHLVHTLHELHTCLGGNEPVTILWTVYLWIRDLVV